MSNTFVLFYIILLNFASAVQRCIMLTNVVYIRIRIGVIFTLILYTDRVNPINFRTCTFDRSCQCSRDTENTHADCSRKNKTLIPKIERNIVHLNLSHNLITSIESGIFKTATRLTVLDLSFNLLTSINHESFAGLHKLQYLNIDNNGLEYDSDSFPKGVFKPLTSLKHLSVKSNNGETDINVFPEGTIEDISLLEKLEIDIPDDSFDGIFRKGYERLYYFSSLVLGQRQDISIRSETFRYAYNLESITIDFFTSVYYYQGGLFNIKRLKYLHLKIYSQSMLENSLPYLVWDLRHSPIQILKLDLSEVTYDDFPLSFLAEQLFYTDITEMYLFNYRHVATQPIISQLPPKLKILDISNNELQYIFLNVSVLTRLSLRENKLAKSLSSTSYTEFYETDTSLLEYIDLSENNLYEVVENAFDGQPNIRCIDLHGNNLQKLTFNLSNLKKLQFLDLSFNSIKSFNNQVIRNFNEISENSNLTIDLSNNPLECSCKTVTFLYWIINSRITFVDYNTYTCKFDNGEVIILDPFGEKVNQLQKQCYSYTLLITGLTIALLAVLVVLLVSIVYRFRWKLRYMYYMTKSKYKQKLSEEVEGKEYIYDGFISYSEEDREFVHHECINKLEKEGGFKLCIHQRDFLPGEDITVNITTSIHKSRKTMCLVSKSFIKSYYCMFEFNMARMESIYSRDGKNVIFLVIYEQLQPKELPLVMLELVQNQSYIEYPNDEQGNIVFWEKIKETLKM